MGKIDELNSVIKNHTENYGLFELDLACGDLEHGRYYFSQHILEYTRLSPTDYWDCTISFYRFNENYNCLEIIRLEPHLDMKSEKIMVRNVLNGFGNIIDVFETIFNDFEDVRTLLIPLLLNEFDSHKVIPYSIFFNSGS